MTQPWYKNVWRRNVIDMHITDHDPSFLTKFDPEVYVARLVEAKVQSTVLYAHSHVGLTNYPTKVARMHPGLDGRDVFGEIVQRCHDNDIAVVGYVSTIFDRHVRLTHPEWQMLSVAGEPVSSWRHGLMCPNSPYRHYFKALLEEVTAYDVEGIRVDMTFWPAACCYCQYCRARYAEEVGGELPTRIDWFDPIWTGFQRKREQWMAEFVQFITTTIKARRPDVTVEHQASGLFMDWRFGVDETLAPYNEALQGDFYGDAIHGSFVRKLFYNLSPNLPYGFETSVCVQITDHTPRKSEPLLTCKSFASLADGGAFIFIDAVDPTGTLRADTYEVMGRVFEKRQPYEAYLGGRLVQDVGVYFSGASKCNFADNGTDLADPATVTNHVYHRSEHGDAAVGACQALIYHHIPFGVITRMTLPDLADYRVIVLPNVLMMNEDEVDAIREYVRQGGCLYASKWTSLVTRDGHKHEDFQLADLFGCTFEAQTEEHYSYIAPVGPGQLFAPATHSHPLAVQDTQLKVRQHDNADVLGELVLPYSDPKDPDHFASIHSNPPGRWTGRPAVLVNSFGKGRVIYSAATLEANDITRPILANLLRMLYPKPAFESDAPGVVEITLFDQPEHSRYILNAVNFQKDLPNLPAFDITIRVRPVGRTIQRVALLPEGQPLPFEQTGGLVEFRLSRLDTFAMVELSHDS